MALSTQTISEDAYRIVFSGNSLVVNKNEPRFNPISKSSFIEQGWLLIREVYVGIWESKEYIVCDIEGSSIDLTNFQLSTLRSLLGNVEDSVFSLIGKAFQLLCWSREHKFCGQCGRKMRPHSDERAMQCAICKTMIYPRISPCIIVLVTKNEKLLLARNINFPSSMYSTLAGFIEVGETVEEAVEREVREEVGISITDISYFGSQPWPFPSQLMLGFHARYLSGDISCNPNEIEEALWFSKHELPLVPPISSIAGRLINTFVKKNLGNSRRKPDKIYEE